jgi:integrase
MSSRTESRTDTESPAVLLGQPNDARKLLPGPERDALVISMRKVDGVWRVVSSYGDDIWWPTGATTNVRQSNTKLDFTSIPAPFRESLKQMTYRYMRKGCGGSKRPGAATLVRGFREMTNFLRYAHTLGVTALGAISPLICSNYVHIARTKSLRGDRPLAPGTLYKRIKGVSDIYELSQYTDDPVPEHPWPDSSADHLSGYSRSKQNNGKGQTPLIPDDIFVSLFQAAWKIVQDAPRLLGLRDEMEHIAVAKNDLHPNYVASLKTDALAKSGFEGTYKRLKMQLLEIRTACYVVIASLSGCRNHELANLRSDSYYSSEDDDGEQYWWLRSESTKTFEGSTEWMVPEAAVVALRVLELWAAPYQDMLRQEIDGYRAGDAGDVRIAQAEDHLDVLFVGVDYKKGNLVRTLGIQALNNDLKDFAKRYGMNWLLASHQFRRKFANYAARSQFGDLRYLREHFKHWTMDMTLGYAMNESQEVALYLEIQDEIDEIKEDVVESWLDGSEPLAGGYGDNIVDWRSRSENITLFKSRAAMIRSIAQSTPIRSNGHAWCTADDNLCVGNDLERTRCGDNCNNAVIGGRHASIYQGLYDHLKQLETSNDIGPGGRERVKRDVTRCATVLGKLGYNVGVIAE